MLKYDATELNRLTVSLGFADRKMIEVGETLTIRTAAAIERDAKTEAPVDTGNLRNSIGTDIKKSRFAVSAEIGPTANYGGYVEFGTSHHGPQPYMGPAFDRHVENFQTALGVLAGQALEGL